MKKKIGIVIVTALCLLSSSYEESAGDWGNWSLVSSSYNGIEARVKMGDYNEYALKYHWEVQFRNRYTQRVQFSYDLTARSEGNLCNPDKRKHLEPGEESDVTAFLVNDDSKVHVCIGEVIFGD